jgi:hypothetical protein
MRSLAALLLLVLAPLAHGADSKRSAKLKDLQRDISNPEGFDRFVEGSPELKAGVAGPGAVSERVFAATPMSGLQKPAPRLRPEQAALPPAPWELRRQASRPLKQPTPELPKGLEYALGGAGLLLIAAGLRSWSSAEPAPRSITPRVKLPEPPAPPAAGTPSSEPPPVDLEPLPPFPPA